MADFYKLRSMLPVIYNKYLVVKWQEGDLYHNLFNVIDAVVASHGPWRGYNVFVDWSDSGGYNKFHDLFTLNIKNEFAHSYSDIPQATLDSVYQGNISRSELLAPPTDEISEFGIVYLDHVYDTSWVSQSNVYSQKLKNTCVEKVKHVWNLQKASRGFYKGKFKPGTVTLGVDVTCITNDNLGDYISVIDSVMRNNLRFRLFVCGVSSAISDLTNIE